MDDEWISAAVNYLRRRLSCWTIPFGKERIAAVRMALSKCWVVTRPRIDWCKLLDQKQGAPSVSTDWHNCWNMVVNDVRSLLLPKDLFGNAGVAAGT